MKKYFFFILWILFFNYGWVSFAQEGEIAPENTCNEHFSINGPEAVYLWETLNYSLSPNIEQWLIFPVSYSFNLKNGEKVIQKSQDSSLQISFWEEGDLHLYAEIQKANCNYSLEKTINTYQKSLVYIGGEEESFQLWFDQNFADQGIYFSTIFLEKSWNEEDIKTVLRKELRNLSFADTILIKSNAFDQILSAYIELLEQWVLEGEAKTIYIISNSNQSFLKRVLSIFVQDLGNNQIATVKSSDFLNLLTALSLNKGEEEIHTFASFHSLQQEKWPRYLILSALVDQAITSGVSLQTLWTLLVITLLVFVISGLRQVVGLSVFGVYQPLLFALTLFLIGWKATLLFFWVAIFSTFILRLISKYLHLLQSAKISLLVCLYCIFLLVWVWADQSLWLWLLGKHVWSNGYIILAIMILLMTSDKIFTEQFKLSKKSGWIALAEFTFITLLSRWILSISFFRTFMLSYPELLFVVIIAVVIIGRFTGLQIFELIRFMPLIRRHLEDEEE